MGGSKTSVVGGVDIKKPQGAVERARKKSKHRIVNKFSCHQTKKILQLCKSFEIKTQSRVNEVKMKVQIVLPDPFFFTAYLFRGNSFCYSQFSAE